MRHTIFDELKASGIELFITGGEPDVLLGYKAIISLMDWEHTPVIMYLIGPSESYSISAGFPGKVPSYIDEFTEHKDELQVHMFGNSGFVLKIAKTNEHFAKTLKRDDLYFDGEVSTIFYQSFMDGTYNTK
jgi:hypothetical protein